MRVLGSLRQFTHAAVDVFARAVVRNPIGRRGLNYLYQRTSDSQKAVLHGRFSRLFYGYGQTSGSWHLVFAGKEVHIPITESPPGLTWDYALSVLGHDADVKAFYRRLVLSPSRPAVFFDVGANFGTHSLLFLVHGIRTVSFEPNPCCHALFRTMADANGVEEDIQDCGISDHRGDATLYFPQEATWLGTTVDSVKSRLEASGSLESHRIELTTLDDYSNQSGLFPDLIKIDTEGNEVRVIRGAAQLMRDHGPLIVFESWPGEARQELFETLSKQDYRIGEPTMRGILDIRDQRAFYASGATNFLASPRKATNSAQATT